MLLLITLRPAQGMSPLICQRKHNNSCKNRVERWLSGLKRRFAKPLGRKLRAGSNPVLSAIVFPFLFMEQPEKPDIKKDLEDPTRAEVQRIMDNPNMTLNEKLEAIRQIEKNNESLPEDDSDLI